MAPLPEVKTYVRVKAETLLVALSERIEAAQKTYEAEEIHYFAQYKKAMDWSASFLPDLQEVFAALTAQQAGTWGELPKMADSGVIFHFSRRPEARLWANLMTLYPGLEYRNIDSYGDIGSVFVPTSPDMPYVVPRDESLELIELYAKLPKMGMVNIALDSPLLEFVKISPNDFESFVR